MTDSPFDQIIPRNSLLRICPSTSILVHIYRAVQGADPDKQECHAQAFVQLDHDLDEQLSRVALPEGTEVHSALQDVRDHREALHASVSAEDFAARVEALREAGDRLKAAVDDWPPSPLLEALQDSLLDPPAGLDPPAAQTEGQEKANVPAEPPPPPAPQAAGKHRFRLKGKMWDVCYGTEQGFFADSEGMQRIAKLLSCPHKSVPALVLAGNSGAGTKAEHTHQPVLDEEALRACHERLREVNADLAKAESNHDNGQVEQLSAEKDRILQQVRLATGIRGKSRSLGSPPSAAKAAGTVRKSLKGAYKKLGKANPPLPNLVAHLIRSIRPDGKSLLYGPVPPEPDWSL